MEADPGLQPVASARLKGAALTYRGWITLASRPLVSVSALTLPVRLAYLESPRLKAVACLGPVVHTLLSDFKCQQQVPEMYLDVLASRLGMHDASDEAVARGAESLFIKSARIAGTSLPNANVIGLLEERSVQPGRGLTLNHLIIC
ncbi:esterase [Escherichia coli]|uniref:Esterase n=1 Tax=Escherichia coli TaxID=562 RepID=A0A377F8N9_ECOLX|nr:esterase [Escherichia coli]